MGTLTGLMHVVTSALAADQKALSATADNISNQNTPGYTRRVVAWTEGDVVNVGTGTSPGVQATVTAQRDRVLQRSVQNASEAASASSTRQAALNQLQDLFKLNASGEDAAGIGAATSNFFNAASAISASPNDSSLRQTLFQAAQTFAGVLNRTASQIGSQAASLNQQVSSSIAQVNALATQVAALNRQIGEAPSDGTRDILLDQRNNAVTQLSSLIDVNTVQSDRDGLSLTLSDGTSLVAGTTVQALSVATVGGSARVYASALLGHGDVTAAIRGGSIGGALVVCDSDAPAVLSHLDALATAVAAAVNGQNAAGLLADGSAGGPIFSGTSAATLSVVATGASAFAITAPGPVPGGNASAMGALQSAGLVGGNTPAGALSAMLVALGSKVSGLGVQATADAAIYTQVSTQLDTISGVSLDDEAANLTRYQRSYQAAAKVLSVVDELLAQAINLGQPTTVN